MIYNFFDFCLKGDYLFYTSDIDGTASLYKMNIKTGVEEKILENVIYFKMFGRDIYFVGMSAFSYFNGIEQKELLGHVNPSVFMFNIVPFSDYILIGDRGIKKELFFLHKGNGELANALPKERYADIGFNETGHEFFYTVMEEDQYSSFIFSRLTGKRYAVGFPDKGGVKDLYYLSDKFVLFNQYNNEANSMYIQDRRSGNTKKLIEIKGKIEQPRFVDSAHIAYLKENAGGKSLEVLEYERGNSTGIMRYGFVEKFKIYRESNNAVMLHSSALESPSLKLINSEGVLNLKDGEELKNQGFKKETNVNLLGFPYYDSFNPLAAYLIESGFKISYTDTLQGVHNGILIYRSGPDVIDVLKIAANNTKLKALVILNSRVGFTTYSIKTDDFIDDILTSSQLNFLDNIKIPVLIIYQKRVELSSLFKNNDTYKSKDFTFYGVDVNNMLFNSTYRKKVLHTIEDFIDEIER